MTEAITLERLTAMIRAEWENWERVLMRVGFDRMEEPGVVGEWSVKDLIAHVAWFERDILLLLQDRSMEHSSPLWNLPPDERNAAIYEDNRSRRLTAVLDEARSIHAGVMQAIAHLSEEDLVNPGAFEGMPAGWVPWEIIRENTCDHYADHAGQISAWLAEKPHPTGSLP